MEYFFGNIVAKIKPRYTKTINWCTFLSNDELLFTQAVPSYFTSIRAYSLLGGGIVVYKKLFTHLFCFLYHHLNHFKSLCTYASYPLFNYITIAVFIHLFNDIHFYLSENVSRYKTFLVINSKGGN